MLTGTHKVHLLKNEKKDKFELRVTIINSNLLKKYRSQFCITNFTTKSLHDMSTSKYKTKILITNLFISIMMM